LSQPLDVRTVRENGADARGAFLITIDTEGDDLWSKPREITVSNALALPRFQELCERYGLKPTYLVNWEMATAASFVEFGRAVLERGTGEIGMHLHAWNSPPLVPLSDDDFTHQPYLLEYPERLIREKVNVMTDTLESTFGVKMRSHRAGRWGLDEVYAKILIGDPIGQLASDTRCPRRRWRPGLPPLPIGCLLHRSGRDRPARNVAAPGSTDDDHAGAPVGRLPGPAGQPRPDPLSPQVGLPLLARSLMASCGGHADVRPSQDIVGRPSGTAGLRRIHGSLIGAHGWRLALVQQPG
jgi:hypothetical protein